MVNPIIMNKQKIIRKTSELYMELLSDMISLEVELAMSGSESRCKKVRKMIHDLNQLKELSGQLISSSESSSKSQVL
jgi:hypothetical protein|nr:MAG TPA: hypothetical protein [Caudoviricetes sp.]